jgi:hypothetical protein
LALQLAPVAGLRSIDGAAALKRANDIFIRLRLNCAAKIDDKPAPLRIPPWVTATERNAISGRIVDKFTAAKFAAHPLPITSS